VGIVSIVVSIAAWRLTVASETHTATLEFAQRADNQVRVLQSGIADYLDKLSSVGRSSIPQTML
jgi:CHASE1-domain containing sensor protein